VVSVRETKMAMAYFEFATEARLGFASEHFASGNFVATNYETTGPEKLGSEVDLRPVRQTDPGKLAREADVPPARDNDLVPDQKERSDDALAI
jgi:hypothetical protein